jgi:hypothetical protein
MAIVTFEEPLKQLLAKSGGSGEDGYAGDEASEGEPQGDAVRDTVKEPKESLTEAKDDIYVMVKIAKEKETAKKPPTPPPPKVVLIIPIETLKLAAPPFIAPPNLGPITNVIVEGPSQRGENTVPSNGIMLTRQMPPQANPYRMLPENYRREQWGDMHNYTQRFRWYDLERPLDLLRYKSDRYWDILEYAGGYAPQREPSVIPFASVSYLKPSKSPLHYELRKGSIIQALRPALQLDQPESNFLGFYMKEKILLKANYNVFSASAPTLSSLPLGTGNEITRGSTSEGAASGFGGIS